VTESREQQPPAPAAVLGVLAGGRGLRMGGCDKAELRTREGESLLERLLRFGSAVQLPCVVVGGVARSDLLVLPDDPPGIGPIGGLRALLAHAGGVPALALACDLPYVSAALISRLAHAPCRAPVLAPRDPETGKWQPLFARYQSAEVLPSLDAAITRGVRSFQTWLRGEYVEELMLSPEERALLADWDEPEPPAPVCR
jgi:molybdopterin-guanine dinucleotide biosynthesis protein A